VEFARIMLTKRLIFWLCLLSAFVFTMGAFIFTTVRVTVASETLVRKNIVGNNKKMVNKEMAGEIVPQLSAAQIIEKNIAARGGIEAWRKVQSMAWFGHIDVEHGPVRSMPFILEQKRPNKTHFEIKSPTQAGVRIFDGTHGWKLRSTRNGMPELRPFTDDEQRFALNSPVIESPLMEYQAKGIDIALDGIDEVEGHKTFRLNVTLPSSERQHVWIDAQTFLDIKSDRQSRNSLGITGTVVMFYRDYREVQGLQIPFVIESGSDRVKATNKMVIQGDE